MGSSPMAWLNAEPGFRKRQDEKRDLDLKLSQVEVLCIVVKDCWPCNCSIDEAIPDYYHLCLRALLEYLRRKFGVCLRTRSQTNPGESKVVLRLV